jgi:hypothetical protein
VAGRLAVSLQLYSAAVKTGIFLRFIWVLQHRRMASSGMLRRLALVRINVSEERSASFLRVTKVGEIGTTLGVTSNRRTLRS